MLRVNGELIDPNLLEDAFARIKSEAEARLQQRAPPLLASWGPQCADPVRVGADLRLRLPHQRSEPRARRVKCCFHKA